MPSREDIVKKLRYAANSIPITAIDNVITDFAAQVAAMRCETCKYYILDGGVFVDFCLKFEDTHGQGKYFGCFAHEQKPAG